jgi:hypothetical protein
MTVRYAVRFHLNAARRTNVLAQIAMDATGQKVGLVHGTGRSKNIFAFIVDAWPCGVPAS